MAFKKRDEIHEKQFTWKLRWIVIIISIIAILLLIYLTSYSFANLGPMITVLLIVILLLVAGIAIFSIDVSFYREIS